MKKPLILTICAFPILLLVTIYVFLIQFDMMKWDGVAMYMLFTAAVLSFLMPVICGLGLIWKEYSSLRLYFAVSCLSSLAFWIACYVDVGDKIRQFYAA
jgi:hypothetical protein